MGKKKTQSKGRQGQQKKKKGAAAKKRAAAAAGARSATGSRAPSDLEAEAQRFDLDSVTAADASPQRDASSDNELDARSLEEAEAAARAEAEAERKRAKAKADADGFGSPKLPRTPRTKDGEPLSAVAAALRESAERRPDDADEDAARAEDDAGSADEDAALFSHPANDFALSRDGGGVDVSCLSRYGPGAAYEGERLARGDVSGGASARGEAARGDLEP